MIKIRFWVNALWNICDNSNNAQLNPLIKKVHNIKSYIKRRLFKYTFCVFNRYFFYCTNCILSKVNKIDTLNLWCKRFNAIWIDNSGTCLREDVHEAVEWLDTEEGDFTRHLGDGRSADKCHQLRNVVVGREAGQCVLLPNGQRLLQLHHCRIHNHLVFWLQVLQAFVEVKLLPSKPKEVRPRHSGGTSELVVSGIHNQ